MPREDWRPKDQGVREMRSLVINKILSFQYRFGKLFERRNASRICGVTERSFTALFGREVYERRR